MIRSPLDSARRHSRAVRWAAWSALAIWTVVVASGVAPRHRVPWAAWRSFISECSWETHAPVAAQLLPSLRDAGAGLAVACAAISCGALVFLLLTPRGDALRQHSTRFERIWICFIAGCAALTLIAIGLAAAKSLYPTALRGILALGLCAGIPALLRVLREPVALHIPTEPTGRVARGIAWVTVGAAFMAAVPMALSPYLQFDSHVYHLALPAAYLQAHGFAAFPHNVFAQAPHNMEMLFCYALVLGSASAAKVLQFTTGIAMLGFVASLGRRVAGPTAGALAMLLTCTSPVFLNQWPMAYVDIAAGAALTGAVWCLVLWAEGAGTGALRIGAVALGLFAGMRYTALHGVVACGVACGVVLWRRHASRAEWFRTVGTLTLGLCLGAGPWLIKNTVYVGNPIFPMGTSLFGLGPRLPSEFARTQIMLQAYGDGHGIWELLGLPWRLAVADPRQVLFSFGQESISPVWLLALPLLLVIRPKTVSLRFISLVVAVGFCSWALTIQVLRYLLPLFGLLSIATVAILLRGLRRNEDWRPHAGAILTLATLATAVWWLPPVVSTGLSAMARLGPVVWGNQPRHAYIAAREPTAPAYGYMADHVPEDAVVIGLWENRLYRCPRPMVGDTMIKVPYWLDRFGAAEDIPAYADVLRREGFTHVLHNRANARWKPFITPEFGMASITKGHARIRDFLSTECTLLYSANDIDLYVLRRTGEP